MIDYKNTSLANQVFAVIEKNILTGVYPAGELITEPKLSAELGVSRTPVREALTKLETERLIRQTANGMLVLGISEKDVDEMYAVKKSMEPYATGLAVQNMTDEYLEKLKEIIEQQEFYVAKGNAEKIKDLDTEFHDVIYEASNSPTLASILSPVHHKLMKFRKVSLQFSNRSTQSVEEHKKIYQAIAKKDESMAKALMLEHVNNAYINIKGGM